MFLPENEIHELGILYLNYLILSNGYRTIFLGQSIQTSSLETLFTYNSTFNFVTYLTVEPNKDEIMPYLNEFHEKLLYFINKNKFLKKYQSEIINSKKEKNLLIKLLLTSYLC